MTVDTNTIGIKYALEQAEGTQATGAPPTTLPAGLLARDYRYFAAEPNGDITFGGTPSTTVRAPISTDRQRRKGTVTDLENETGWTEDLTYSAFANLISPALAAHGDNAVVQEIASTGALATGNTYAVAALTAAQADLLHQHSLLWIDGFDAPGSNGLKLVTTDPADGAATIVVSDVAADDSSGGTVSLCGYRIPAATTKNWTYSAAAGTATLVSTGIAQTLMGAGLSVGQLVHIGSVASAGAADVSDLANGMGGGAGDLRYGYARVAGFSGNDTIVFDKLTGDSTVSTDRTDLAMTAAVTNLALDILFGDFLRNVPVDDSRFSRRPLTVEMTSPGLDPDRAGDKATTPIEREDYEYSRGNLVNTLTLSLPLTDKSTMQVAMLGRDVSDAQAKQNGTAREPDGANADRAPRLTDAYNTVLDFARLRVQRDRAGLTTDFASATLTIGNNLTGEKVLGFLGNRFVSYGSLEVGFAAEVIFASSAIPEAIRRNHTLTADFILKNGDGVIGIDLPTVTMGGGGRSFPENQKVTIAAELSSFGDAAGMNTSIGVSLIPVPLPSGDDD